MAAEERTPGHAQTDEMGTVDQSIIERVKALREKMLAEKGIQPISPVADATPFQCGSWTHFQNG